MLEESNEHKVVSVDNLLQNALESELEIDISLLNAEVEYLKTGISYDAKEALYLLRKKHFT